MTSSQRPRILLTNDDGVYAEGIRALLKAIRSEGIQVAVVAPDREMSASGHAITMHRPLMVQACDLEGTVAWAVSGTPADCTKLAIQGLLEERPDLVISGINRGPNLGTDVFYSGTVSAAVEACIHGIPSFAVSVTAWENPEYDLAASLSLAIAERILGEGLPRGVLLNVNVPALPAEQVSGIAVTKLGNRQYDNVFDRRTDPRGRVYYWMAGEVVQSPNQEGTDVWAIENNLASVTPIRIDLTAEDVMPRVRGWNLRFEELGCHCPADDGGAQHGVSISRRGRLQR